MPRANRRTKNQARRMYEEDGESYAAIGREINFGPQTIKNWAKAEGWVKAGSTPRTPVGQAIDDLPDDTETIGAPIFTEEPVFTEAPVESDADLRARIAALEAENKRLADEAERLKPTRDVTEMIENRVDWLTTNTPEGERYWMNRAEAEYKKTNKERAKEGLPIFDIKDHPEILEDLMVELKTKEEMAKNKVATGPASRKVKLYIERNGMPTIEQIPMESQINNMGGSLADGIVRYTRKGFKMTDPFLCPRANCFRPAGTDELGRWEYDGYCTERHRTEVEGPDQGPTVGLQTKDTILSGTY
ncbi:hypothetical protein ACFL0N_01760 [Pseudomonadota bacterium]